MGAVPTLEALVRSGSSIVGSGGATGAGSGIKLGARTQYSGGNSLDGNSLYTDGYITALNGLLTGALGTELDAFGVTIGIPYAVFCVGARKFYNSTAMTLLAGTTITIQSTGANDIALTPGTGKVKVTAGDFDIQAGVFRTNGTTRMTNAGVLNNTDMDGAATGNILRLRETSGAGAPSAGSLQTREAIVHNDTTAGDWRLYRLTIFLVVLGVVGQVYSDTRWVEVAAALVAGRAGAGYAVSRGVAKAGEHRNGATTTTTIDEAGSTKTSVTVPLSGAKATGDAIALPIVLPGGQLVIRGPDGNPQIVMVPAPAGAAVKP